jgi:peptidoglycan/LPS O-acetylase OafA/YrhL
MRRSLRIFPLYYTVLLVYVASVWLLERDSQAGREFFSNLPYFLTYTSNWFVPLEGRVIFFFAWSLATEEQFYLLWPSVEKFLKGWRAAWVIGALLVLRSAVSLGVGGGALSTEDLWVRVVLSIHPAILGGVLLAHLLHDGRTFGWMDRMLGRRWSAPVILLVLLACIEAGLPLTLVWAAMVLLVGAVVIREDNGLATMLRWKPVAHIGVVSYGMYLLHMLSYHAARKVLAAVGLDEPWIWFPATVVVATVVATLSFRYYESWFLRLKTRYARTSTHARAPQPSGRASGGGHHGTRMENTHA